MIRMKTNYTKSLQVLPPPHSDPEILEQPPTSPITLPWTPRTLHVSCDISIHLWVSHRIGPDVIQTAFYVGAMV